MKSTVSEKGQVTIPKKIRDRYGLQPGMEVEFRSEAGMVVLVKIVPRDPLDKWRGRGKLPKGLDVDAYLRKARDENSH